MEKALASPTVNSLDMETALALEEPGASMSTPIGKRTRRPFKRYTPFDYANPIATTH